MYKRQISDFNIEKSNGAIIVSWSQGFPFVNSYLNLACLGNKYNIKIKLKKNKNNLNLDSSLFLSLDKKFITILGFKTGAKISII